MSDDTANSVFEYENQLKAVEEALKHASGEQEVELLDLKYKLLEVIYLLQGDKGEKPDNKSLDCTEEPGTSVDDEFAKFQMEIRALEGNSLDEDNDSTDSSSSSKNEDQPQPGREELDQELMQIISSLEGSKCRAPFQMMSGEREYYNALIVEADYDPDTMQSVEDIEVKVMFCNPVCDQMKPCSFFLDGHCKFSEEKCRYSHGHKVNFQDLQEFVLPDLRNLKIDSKCLAKCDDGLWQKATVEKCLDNQKYSVKFDKSGKTDTLEAQCILPLENHHQLNHMDSEDDDSCSSSEYGSPNPSKSDAGGADSKSYILSPLCPAEWEQHTKGIGSKLMEKMGHVWGQGLGKNSDGRLEPVEAMILPAGKSLDKCIEMRDRCDRRGPVAIETRLALEQDKEEQRAKKVKTDTMANKKETVFDFLNTRIAKVKDDLHAPEHAKNFHTDSDGRQDSKDLNIQIFSVGEDIRRAKKELSRLQQCLLRNSNRNESTRLQVQKKIAAQSDLLRNLQAKETKLNKDMKTQNSQKKLSVF